MLIGPLFARHCFVVLTVSSHKEAMKQSQRLKQCFRGHRIHGESFVFLQSLTVLHDFNFFLNEFFKPSLQNQLFNLYRGVCRVRSKDFFSPLSLPLQSHFPHQREQFDTNVPDLSLCLKQVSNVFFGQPLRQVLSSWSCCKHTHLKHTIQAISSP